MSEKRKVERQRQRHRQTEIQRYRDTEREREKDRQRDKQRERERDFQKISSSLQIAQREQGIQSVNQNLGMGSKNLLKENDENM